MTPVKSLQHTPPTSALTLAASEFASLLGQQLARHWIEEQATPNNRPARKSTTKKPTDEESNPMVSTSP